jgi:hypothetical protein
VGTGWEDQPADQVSSVRFGARRGPTVTGGQVVATSHDEADQEEKREAVLVAVYKLLKELESRRALPAGAPSD